MSSTNFGSILIFASCVVGTCNALFVDLGFRGVVSRTRVSSVVLHCSFHSFFAIDAHTHAAARCWMARKQLTTISRNNGLTACLCKFQRLFLSLKHRRRPTAKRRPVPFPGSLSLAKNASIYSMHTEKIAINC